MQEGKEGKLEEAEFVSFTMNDESRQCQGPLLNGTRGFCDNRRCGRHCCRRRRRRRRRRLLSWSSSSLLPSLRVVCLYELEI